jgi:hypothetical protein
MVIHIDYDALWKDIGERMAGPVEELANEIASHVDVGSVTDAKVGVMMSTTRKGWPVALVTILHPAGEAIQAKHGALTKAAAAVGLEIRAKQ